MSAWSATIPFFEFIAQKGLDFKIDFEDCDSSNYGGFINCIDGEVEAKHYWDADWTIYRLEKDPYRIDDILESQYGYRQDGETFEEWKESRDSLPEDPRILKLIADSYKKYGLLKSVQAELSLDMAQKIGAYKTGHFNFPVRQIDAQPLKEILAAVHSLGFNELEELDEECANPHTENKWCASPRKTKKPWGAPAALFGFSYFAFFGR